MHDITKCKCCAAELPEGGENKSPQIFDIPKIKIRVAEHRTLLKTCSKCEQKNNHAFPETTTADALLNRILHTAHRFNLKERVYVKKGSFVMQNKKQRHKNRVHITRNTWCLSPEYAEIARRQQVKEELIKVDEVYRSILEEKKSAAK